MAFQAFKAILAVGIQSTVMTLLLRTFLVLSILSVSFFDGCNDVPPTSSSSSSSSSSSLFAQGHDLPWGSGVMTMMILGCLDGSRSSPRFLAAEAADVTETTANSTVATTTAVEEELEEELEEDTEETSVISASEPLDITYSFQMDLNVTTDLPNIEAGLDVMEGELSTWFETFLLSTTAVELMGITSQELEDPCTTIYSSRCSMVNTTLSVLKTPNMRDLVVLHAALDQIQTQFYPTFNSDFKGRITVHFGSPLVTTHDFILRFLPVPSRMTTVQESYVSAVLLSTVNPVGPFRVMETHVYMQALRNESPVHRSGNRQLLRTEPEETILRGRQAPNEYHHHHRSLAVDDEEVKVNYVSVRVRAECHSTGCDTTQFDELYDTALVDRLPDILVTLQLLEIQEASLSAYFSSVTEITLHTADSAPVSSSEVKPLGDTEDDGGDFPWYLAAVVGGCVVFVAACTMFAMLRQRQRFKQRSTFFNSGSKLQENSGFQNPTADEDDDGDDDQLQNVQQVILDDSILGDDDVYTTTGDDDDDQLTDTSGSLGGRIQHNPYRSY